ncbi:MAG TPA: RtcB family protein [Trueperaceae bacterium]|nr:RtcB family protein [Trueperaceae bacterium]HRQ09751.1 RtcB family protein [Trueperaceae bacterium]
MNEDASVDPTGTATPMKIFGEHEENTLEQLRDVASRAVRVALMADGHLGYVMPIGGVAAYRNQVSVTGVGFDIACGNAAILTDLTLSADLGLEALADEIWDSFAFGVGQSNKADDAPVDHPLFDSPAWEHVPAEHREQLRERARSQLGSIGSGNHYIDVFADEQERLWVGVHFGSRGLGHTVASGYLALAQGKKWGARAPEVEALLSLDSELGASYWEAMNLAGKYAYAGREWVAREVVSIMGGRELELVHNNHNFAWREEHFGEELIVVRKGATPAFPGQRGFVGGSMGDDSVILMGSLEGSVEQQEALFSTVHGAGRVMSRTEAAGTRGRRRRGKNIRGSISRGMMNEWLERKDVILRGGGRDEAPQAYRRLAEVIEAQGDTIEVLHALRPLIVAMAAPDRW